MQRATTIPMDTILPLPFILTSPPPLMSPLPLMTPTILFPTLMAMSRTPWTMWRARPMDMILLDLSTITQDLSAPSDSTPISSMKNNSKTFINYFNSI